MPDRNVVKVLSRLENAIQLRVYDMHDGEHASYSINVTGTPTARRKGEAVTIAPGTVTEVDADFWREWTEQNKGGALLGEGLLSVHDDAKERKR